MLVANINVVSRRSKANGIAPRSKFGSSFSSGCVNIRRRASTRSLHTASWAVGWQKSLLFPFDNVRSTQTAGHRAKFLSGHLDNFNQSCQTIFALDCHLQSCGTTAVVVLPALSPTVMKGRTSSLLREALLLPQRPLPRAYVLQSKSSNVADHKNQVENSSFCAKPDRGVRILIYHAYRSYQSGSLCAWHNTARAYLQGRV